MSRVVILHGRPDEEEYLWHDHPSASNSHWIPWLQNELLIAGHDVQTPEVFRPFEDRYDRWASELERCLVPEPMILVGYSCGAGVLVRWLSEHSDVNVEKLVLVAPWLNPDTARAPWLDIERVNQSFVEFFNFGIDDFLPSRVGEFHIFHSSDDQETIRATVEVLLKHFPDVIQHSYNDMGHFTLEDMGTVQFPDLLAAITK